MNFGETKKLKHKARPDNERGTSNYKTLNKEQEMLNNEGRFNYELTFY